MKIWTIIISIGNRNITFDINERYYLIFIVILSLFSSLFLYFNIEGYKRRANILKVERLKKEKENLIRYFNDLNEKLICKQIETESIFAKTILISYISENYLPENFNRNMGIGGFFEKIDINDIKVSKDLENAILEKERIKNIINFQFNNIERSKKKFNEKEAISKATPSIWPTYGYLTAGFGNRVHPVYKNIEFHKGIDIANHNGTSVFASAYGKVTFAGWKNGYGNTVIIEHGYGYKTKYAHLKDIYVKTGTYVKRGQLIGTIGSTGLTTGPHLHYEVLVSDKPVNPWGYLDNSKNTY